MIRVVIDACNGIPSRRRGQGGGREHHHKAGMSRTSRRHDTSLAGEIMMSSGRIQRFLMRRTSWLAVVALLGLGLATAPAEAAFVTFVTPTGSSTGGGPVNASADITTGAGNITIT